MPNTRNPRLRDSMLKPIGCTLGSPESELTMGLVVKGLKRTSIGVYSQTAAHSHEQTWSERITNLEVTSAQGRS